MSSLKALFDLHSRRALVTGSSRGIGRAIALGLAEFGADVAIHCGRSRDRAEAVATEARAFGVKACVIEADMAADDQPRRMFDEAVAELGSLDIVVPNVSVQIREDWSTITREQFDQQVSINMRSTMELMQLAVPAMAERGWGRVVVVGSVQQSKPSPAMMVYASTKAALSSMAQTIARQVGKRGVTVNVLAPGIIATDRNAEALADPAKRERIAQRLPVPRMGEPIDCAGAAVWLCSDAASYVTGQDIYTDGGMGLP